MDVFGHCHFRGEKLNARGIFDSQVGGDRREGRVALVVRDA